MKFILYTYYRINKFCYSLFEDFVYVDNINTTMAPPGLVVVGLCEIFVAFTTVEWFHVLTKIKFTSGIPLLIAGLMVITFHYFTFHYKNRLRRFYREVKSFSRTKKIIWDGLVILSILFMITYFIVSFAELDK